MTATSTHLKEFQVPAVTGVEVARHRGVSPLAGAAAVGAVLNCILLVVIASWLGSGSRGPYYSYSNPLPVFGAMFGFLAVASLVVGAVVVALLARPTASINIVGPGDVHGIAQSRDLAGIIVVVLLFLIFGPFISLAVIIWVVLRELGMFKADDAQLFADPNNIDRISYEVGALILDVQARGKLAGQK